jgi:Concanavalin A-like lectin/glucanases superfamily/Putative Ig domain/FG-GAP-like repeat/FG-GAP repeat
MSAKPSVQNFFGEKKRIGTPSRPDSHYYPMLKRRTDMNRLLKTSLTPAALRARSLVLGQARCLMAIAVVLISIASFCFIARHAGAADGDQSAGTGGRVRINSSGAKGTGAPSRDTSEDAPGCVAPPANMVAWYPGDGNALDLQGGDSGAVSGSGGMMTFPAGKVAQAFQFNGGGDLQVVDQPALDVTAAVTLDAWINPTADSSFGVIVGKGNFGSGSDQPYVLHQNGERKISFRVGNSSTFDALNGVTQIPLNAYTHVAATYDGTTMSIYINGNLDASKTTTIGTLVNSNQPLLIGNGYLGAIDEVEIFGRALAQSEIQAIVAADSAGKCKNTTPPPPPPTACITPPANMTVWFAGDGNTVDLQGGDSATPSQAPGTVTFVPGKVGQAFQFNGGDLRVADAPAQDVTNALTLDVWFKPANVAQFQTFIVFKGNTNTAGGQPYSLLYDNTFGHRRIFFRVGNNSTVDGLASITEIPLDAYTHVAATYDGARMRLYINGNLDAVKTTTIGTLANSDLPLIIGSGHQDIVDELEIFNRVLLLSEIQLLAAADSFGKCKPPPAPTPTPTSCVMPPAGMSAWYPFDGNTQDIQNANDGNLFGIFAPGKVADAIHFNGSGEVQVSDAPALEATTALTLDAWVNPVAGANFGGLSTIVFKGNTDRTPQSYALFLRDDRRINFRIGNATTLDAVDSITQIPLNAYTHVAATYDGTRMRLYINGNLDVVKTTTNGPLPDTDKPLLIGAGYQGAIDELEIFNNRVLSEAEIKLLVAAGSFGKCKPAAGCRVITLTPASLPNGALDTIYTPQTIRAGGAGNTTGPFTYIVTSGALPPGLTLNSQSGQLSGTPTAAGAFTFTVTATNTSGCSGSRAYTLTIDLTPSCVAPPAGMVAWLPGDGNANDISGNNNHGTPQNGATFAPGKVAQAFALDGVDDYVLVNHSPSLMPTAITIDLWVNPTSYGSPYNRIIEKGGATATDNGGYGIEFNPCEDGQPTCPDGSHGVVFLIWSDDGTFATVHSNDPLPLNTWTHIAATFTGPTFVGPIMHLYINGTKQTTGGLREISMGSTTDNLAIGRRPNFAEKYFPGRIDEVEIFNRALSQEEIQSIVSAGSAGKCKPNASARRTPYDFDGDGKTDVASWNPSTHHWLIRNSADGATRTQLDWGNGSLGDIAVPRDYDGDGKTDIAVFRPSEGNWYIIQSATNTVRLVNWGGTGDRPVPADYDADGKTDIAVFRPSEGNWYIINSATNTLTVRGWGDSSRADIAVYRPLEGNWYIINSLSNTVKLVNWGTGDDRPVPADYDGDGRTDTAVFRPSEGNWHIINSNGGAMVRNWGNATDKLVPGDYDGDGRTDIAVFRPSESNWYIIQSSTNTGRLENFAQGADDVPASSTFIP